MGEIAAKLQTPGTQNNAPESKQRIYPELIIPNNAHPKKLYAFPVIGLLIKCILVIPVCIVYILITLVFTVLWFITPFVILFTGKYWDTAYKFTLGYLTYNAKIVLFITGITDKYPGFTLEPDGIFEIRLAKPTAPSRILALPVLGIFIRIIILIPFSIYQTVLSYGLSIAMIASWFGVWIKGTYPESLYEFIKDELRVNLAYTSYTSYLSDTYPSFKISMNHKKIKIILLILGIILTLIDFSNNFGHMMNNPAYYNNP